MKRILIIIFIGFVLNSVQAQMNNPLLEGMPNTVKLSDGEIVYDLNGEWNSFVEAYGPWKMYGAHQNIIRIKQSGCYIVGVLVRDDVYYAKGSKSIIAELAKDGFRKIEMLTNLGTLDATGQISDNGNKILLDDGEKRRMTLTRR